MQPRFKWSQGGDGRVRRLTLARKLALFLPILPALRMLLRLLLLLPALLLGAGAARAEVSLETQIKASYLYKFATYVDWPGAPSSGPLVIGVAGADELAEQLRQLGASHQVRNRPVQVRVLKSGAPLDGLHILYVGHGAEPRAAPLLDAVARLPVLTVTESSGMLGSGSIINLLLVDDRVRFEVSLAHAGGSGLRISARLLEVAYRIEGKAP